LIKQTTSSFSEKTVWLIFQQLTSVVGILKKKNPTIKKSDLSANNILIQHYNPETGEISIAVTDFDVIREEIDANLTKRVGKLGYMAPEAYDTSDDVTYSTKVDIWSLGIVMYEIMTRSSCRWKKIDEGNINDIRFTMKDEMMVRFYI
jgi:serine/threonine protein kinase